MESLAQVYDIPDFMWQQQGEACQQRVDADGNWLRQTDGKIQDKAIER